MQSDTLHDFHHSLSVAKVSISLPPPILRNVRRASPILPNVRRVYQFLNVVIINWLNYCRSEVVVLDRYWSWIFRRARKTSCGCTGALLSTRWSGLQTQFSRQPLLAPRRKTFLCLTFQPYKQEVLSFSTTGSRNLHTRSFASDVALALAFSPSQAPIPIYPMKHCPFIYTTMETCRGDAHSSVELAQYLLDVL